MVEPNQWRMGLVRFRRIFHGICELPFRGEEDDRFVEELVEPLLLRVSGCDPGVLDAVQEGHAREQS